MLTITQRLDRYGMGLTRTYLKKMPYARRLNRLVHVIDNEIITERLKKFLATSFEYELRLLREANNAHKYSNEEGSDLAARAFKIHTEKS